MKKKILFIIVVALLSATSAFAQGGTTGPLTWQLTGTAPNLTLTISGEGEMPDYTYPDYAPWYNYKGSITIVKIENGVTKIGKAAFYYHPVLNSITIPSSVTTIGESAISSCNALASVIIPNSVINIEMFAFSNCGSLVSVTIPNSVESIGHGVFLDCNALTSIEVESQNEYYSSVNGILLNKEKTILICCPKGKTNNFTIPNSVSKIETQAFYHCYDLTSIIIPNCVTNIENMAFYNTGLTSIIIPSSVTTIGSAAFNASYSLSSITVHNLIPVTIDESVFACDGVDPGTITLKVPTKAISAYQSPGGIWNNFNIIGGGALINPISSNCEYGYTIGNELYEINATATVTAMAYSGYKFVNWTKNGEIIFTENTYSFTVTDDVVLVANFEEIQYLVSVSVNNDEYGAATGGGYFYANEVATLTATANSDYKFVNWTKNGAEISKDNPYSFTVNEDIELVANFEEEVGIEKFEQSTLKIYPNPTTGELRITSKETELAFSLQDIVIFDKLGRNVGRNLHIAQDETGTILTDISHLPNGIYFIRVKNEIVKIVKQ